jgi:hypothetical protein
MTVEMLIEVLKLCPPDMEIYVLSPDEKEDYFVERVRQDFGTKQAHIITSC